MSNEIREAAEYTLRCLDSGRPDMLINIGVRQLAEAYLAEHPEDDDVELSDEWLDSCKGLARDGCEWSAWGPDSNYLFVITHDLDHSYGVNLVDGEDDINLRTVKTRGDVRRLCRGLKIELKEGGK